MEKKKVSHSNNRILSISLMNKELNCRWHFESVGRGSVGKDATSATFNQPYYSIVRESLQNSLDAYRYDDQPVEVHFSRLEISSDEFPNFYCLEQHLVQCAKYVSFDKNTQDWVNKMLDYIRTHKRMMCLKISDYNTKGMSWKNGAPDSPFLNFVESIGLSADKGSGSQGSFGFGKGAYFSLSPISTVLVSSVDISGNPIFEGVTKITTHEDSSGNKVSSIGYYDNKGSKPILFQEDIPELFRRTEVGTDFIIAGYLEEEDDETQMVKSVLNNFWFPILDNKLKVKVFDKEINAGNVYTMARQYFRDESEPCATNDYLGWNPVPYIKCVKNASKVDKKYKTFTKTGEVIGEMRLYVYRNQDLPNRVVYCRKHRMVVYKQTKNKLSGYVAVFVCENKRGDDLLKAIENQSHNEWDDKNLKSNDFTLAECRTALREIADFVNRSLESLNSAGNRKVAYFEGLEEFFSVGEDLLDNEEYYDGGGRPVNNVEGDSSETPSEEETGALTTTTDDAPKKKTVISKGTYVPTNQIENVSSDENGEPFVASHTHSGENDDDNHYPGKGGKPSNQSTDDSSAKRMRRLIRVKAVSVAHMDENNNLCHAIIIQSPENVEAAEIEVFDSTDNSDIVKADIYDCFDGEVEGNIISGVDLKQGLNRIELAFNDNLKHSIKIQAYEIE